jgi:hypothetical protein
MPGPEDQRHRSVVIMSRATFGLLAVLGACAGCSSSDGASSGAPPLVVCGTTLSRSAAGAVMQDASSGPLTINHVTAGGDIYLKLSPHCDAGARVTILPSTAASVVREARTTDAGVAAIVLHPRVTLFNVQVDQPSGTAQRVNVMLERLG